MTKEEMLELRLQGLTYDAIAKRAGVTRQRVQQIISPPPEIRWFVLEKFHGCCANCGLLVGSKGHIHHKDADNSENYQDIDNLELLCISCHRRKHSNNLILEENGQPSSVGRDTVILPVRIKKDLLKELEQWLPRTNQPSRNAWMIWAVKTGMRSHSKQDGK